MIKSDSYHTQAVYSVQSFSQSNLNRVLTNPNMWIKKSWIVSILWEHAPSSYILDPPWQKPSERLPPIAPHLLPPSFTNYKLFILFILSILVQTFTLSHPPPLCQVSISVSELTRFASRFSSSPPQAGAASKISVYRIQEEKLKLYPGLFSEEGISSLKWSPNNWKTNNTFLLPRSSFCDVGFGRAQIPDLVTPSLDAFLVVRIMSVSC